MTTAEIVKLEQYLVAFILSVIGGLFLLYIVSFFSVAHSTGYRIYRPLVVIRAVVPINEQIRKYRINKVNCEIHSDYSSCSKKYEQEGKYPWLLNQGTWTKSWHRKVQSPI